MNAPRPPAGSAACALVLAALLVLGCTRAAPPAPPAEDVLAEAAAAPSAAHRDVVLLRSASFEVRSEAARRLVEAGEGAIGPLGEAGEGTVRVHGTEDVSTTRPVLRTLLATLPTARLDAYLDAVWPIVRCMAAQEMGRRDTWIGVPRLIARMDDPDEEVRAAAATSLRRLTNRFFGFDARADARSRTRAARRWREWWATEGRMGVAQEHGGGSG